MDKDELKRHHDFLIAMLNKFGDTQYELNSKRNKRDKLLYERQLDSIIHTVDRYISSDMELYNFITSNELNSTLDSQARIFFYDEFLQRRHFPNDLRQRLNKMKELI